jgi:hypothetical protein
MHAHLCKHALLNQVTVKNLVHAHAFNQTLNADMGPRLPRDTKCCAFGALSTIYILKKNVGLYVVQWLLLPLIYSSTSKVLLRVMEMVKDNQIAPEMALKLLEPPSAAAKSAPDELLESCVDSSTKRKRESPTQASESTPSDPMLASPPKKDPKCMEPLLKQVEYFFFVFVIFNSIDRYIFKLEGTDKNTRAQWQLPSKDP